MRAGRFDRPSVPAGCSSGLGLLVDLTTPGGFKRQAPPPLPCSRPGPLFSVCSQMRPAEAKNKPALLAS
ncbi:hypothetical protein PoB_004558300 [Plakobranchus ocellatus]|uniref:Uncharacterized protein n=1 Tax=Plakobranchus ocellatus TaxID=259542 RepID=A0AAV4BJX4_9GAST|nr:hypothetical protein PoB_004558300 [Plakobranchus ocellatus]